MAASELGDDGLLGGDGGGACSALSGLTRRGDAGETNKRSLGRVASSWRQWPDRWGQRRRTASTWRAQPDGGRPRRSEPETL